jgi:hypothetical protein
MKCNLKFHIYQMYFIIIKFAKKEEHVLLYHVFHFVNCILI